MSSVTVPIRDRLQPRRGNRLYWAIEDALVLAWRRLVQIPRIPDELVFATIQPIMFVVLFRYVFGSSITGVGPSYANFFMAGIFVQTVVFGATTTGVGLAQDLEKGLIDRFRSLPMAQSAVLTGRTLADLARNIVVVVVMLAVGLAVGFRPSGSPWAWLGAFGLLLLVTFSFSWISATVGLVSRTVEVAQSAGFIWLFPLTFASSAFVPTKNFPDWLRTFADHQPITWMVNAVRDLLLGQPWAHDTWIAVAWCVGILVVFIPVSVWTYGRRVGR
jgi:ABC-2 type transport system permease protein/oleandomycin transport system permease protein